MEVVTIKDKTQRQVLMLEASEAEMAANILDWVDRKYNDVLNKETKLFIRNVVRNFYKFNGGR